MGLQHDVTEYTVDTWTLYNARALAARLDREGIVVFRGQNPLDVLGAFDQIAEPQAHPDDEAEGVTRLLPRDDVAGQPGFDGFSRKAMPPHTDGSAADQPAELIGIICIKPTLWGGEVLLVDGAAVVGQLTERSPEAVRELLQPRTATFGQEHRPFRVLDEREGRTFIRYRQDGLGDYCAVHAAVQEFNAIVQANIMTVTLGPGDGYILQNGQWLHGRSAFSGHREVLRLLGRSRRQGSRPVVRFGFQLDIRRSAKLSA